jgi:hypothetical protein
MLECAESVGFAPSLLFSLNTFSRFSSKCTVQMFLAKPDFCIPASNEFLLYNSMIVVTTVVYQVRYYPTYCTGTVEQSVLSITSAGARLVQYRKRFNGFIFFRDTMLCCTVLKDVTKNVPFYYVMSEVRAYRYRTPYCIQYDLRFNSKFPGFLKFTIL